MTKKVKRSGKVIQLDAKPSRDEMDFLDRQFKRNPRPFREENGQELIHQYHTIVVFATPQEILDLDIGYTSEQFPDEYELDQYLPWDIPSLCQEIRFTTIGVDRGEELKYPIPNSMCEVNVVIKINDKYCKLNEGEWSARNFIHVMTPATQIRVFQRLLNQKLITMHDLEAADIDTEVYKRLLLNEAAGEQLYRKKMARLMIWLDRQRDDPILKRKVDYYMQCC